MTKAELIALVKIQLASGAPLAKQEGKYHDVTIEKHISMVVSELMATAKDTFLLQQFSVLYPEQTVLTSGNQKYIDLPAAPLLLPNQFGIWIEPAGGGEQFMVRKTNGLYRYLEAAQIWTKNAFRLQGQRIIFESISNVIEKVDLYMLVGFDELGEDDYLYMPGGKDAAAFQMIMNSLQGLPLRPEKRKSDTNPDSQ